MRLTSRSQDSMLEGSIWKGLIAFALPILFGNLFQQLYNTADAIIVGNFLSKEALAAVSSSSNLIHLLVSFLQGTSIGAGVLIARYFGAGDRAKLQQAIHTGLAFALAATGEPGALTAAFALALGMGLQNFPEGAVISMPLLGAGLSRRRAFTYGALSGVVEPIGALLTILLMHFILPAFLSLGISEGMRKAGWIRPNDMLLRNDIGK